MSEERKLPSREKPSDGKLRKQPPQVVKTPYFFGEPKEEAIPNKTPEEQELILELSQTKGFEGIAEATEIIRAARAEKEERKSRVKEGAPITNTEDATPTRAATRYITVDKEVEKYITERHYVQKLSGIAAGFIAGASITIIIGAVVFSQLLSEGYIRQYFY